MNPRITRLDTLLHERILMLDGAMGTMIQGYRLSEADYRGERFQDFPHDLKGNNDLLTLTQPHIIREIHAKYLDAGADIIETNTFNSTAIAQADYHLQDLVYELNREAARLARAVADEREAQDRDRPRYVAGALGPTNRTASISPDVNDPGARNVTFDALVTAYGEAADGLGGRLCHLAAHRRQGSPLGRYAGGHQRARTTRCQRSRAFSFVDSLHLSSHRAFTDHLSSVLGSVGFATGGSALRAPMASHPTPASP